VQVIRRSTGANDVYYVTTDHLGSTDAVLNAAGTVLMAGSFDVHGKRRSSNWQGAPSPAEWQAIAATTRRGYTGHEQIDNVMLIHMNARVFDPVMGRFLSADPFVDGPESTQGWNRKGHLQQEHIRGEIGQVAAGSLQGRGSDSSITVYKSLGLAAQDLIAA
jgi:RHS repeat-associated protein